MWQIVKYTFVQKDILVICFPNQYNAVQCSALQCTTVQQSFAKLCKLLQFSSSCASAWWDSVGARPHICWNMVVNSMNKDLKPTVESSRGLVQKKPTTRPAVWATPFLLRLSFFHLLGKYHNCQLVLKGFFWFFLVLFLVPFFFLILLILIYFYFCSSSSMGLINVWKSDSCDTCHY